MSKHQGDCIGVEDSDIGAQSQRGKPSPLENGWLPPKNQRAAAPDVSRGVPQQYGILVVDDDAAVRGLLEFGLRHQGFAVWLAANGPEALEQYRRHGATIDVALLDVLMPGLDGPQTLATLQELNPQVRCCFMSGDLGLYGEWQLQSMGAAAVFHKPFRLAEVAQVLWDLAGQAVGSLAGP